MNLVSRRKAKKECSPRRATVLIGRMELKQDGSHVMETGSLFTQRNSPQRRSRDGAAVMLMRQQ
jgi:hypothetical protein